MKNTNSISPLSTIAVVPIGCFVAPGLNLSHGVIALRPPFNCCRSTTRPPDSLVEQPGVKQACCTSPAASVFIFVGLGKAVGLSFF